jgi:uncharacterized protein GlcG (DUF336 family)
VTESDAITTAHHVSAAAALRAISAAVDRAEDLGAPATVAVVDADGRLKAMVRMDGAPVIGLDLARRKAFTCLALGGTDTGVMADAIAKNAHLLAALTSLPDIALLAGGVPLRVGAKVVGAVGISAPNSGTDLDIAAAATAAVGNSS